MNILTAMLDYLGQLERRRRYHRTESLVSNLPPEVLKDIGWPGASEGFDRRREYRRR